jgi:peptide/nickel transport system permease protein
VLTYVVRRILTTFPLLFAALYLIHVGVSFTTDPLGQFRLCLPRCQEGYDRIVERYELDKSIWVRPFTWFRSAMQGDLGFSETLGKPVGEVLLERGANTAMIAVPAFVLSAILAVLLSVYSARRQYSKGDYFFTGLSFIGLALPTFFIGLFLQVFWGVWFPEWTGWKPFYTGLKRDDTFLMLLQSITLPIVTLMIVSVASESRFGRANMLEVVSSDYIRTARAKGLSERKVIWKHALRNALIPLVTLWALDFAALLSGSVITETIFSWPGLGPAFLTALSKPDLDLIMGIAIFSAFIAIMFNLIADVLYGWLDPRIRLD